MSRKQANQVVATVDTVTVSTARASPAVQFAMAVDRALLEIGDMLKAKNAAYGNSALDPIRVFSTATTDEQLRVRIDDKLSRLKRGNAGDEDVITDLIGYLVLLRIAGRAGGGESR